MHYTSCACLQPSGSEKLKTDKQPKTAVALKIHKPYTDLLFSGHKRVELRRVIPKRPVGCAFVYETGTKKMRGTLVMRATEKVQAQHLSTQLSEDELRYAARYIDGKSGTFCIFRLDRCVAFENPYLSSLVRQRFGKLQSFTYLNQTEPVAIELLWQHLSGTVHEERRVLSLHSVRLSDEQKVDTDIVREVGKYYDEIPLGFDKTHLPPVGLAMDTRGFSSLQKMALTICRDEQPVGKVVLTLKRGITLKVAPIYIAPPFRGRGLGTRAVTRIVARARELGVRQVFTTVPTNNQTARAVFVQAGFRPIGILHGHYRPEVDEEILVAWPKSEPITSHAMPCSWPLDAHSLIDKWVNAHFFPTDDTWRNWLKRGYNTLNHFEGKPHIVVNVEGCAALVIFKRGGTAKIIPAVRNSVIPPALVNAWEHAALAHGRRKVTVSIPACLEAQKAMSEYRYEATLSTYATFENIHLLSRIIRPGTNT